ncbi:hypothetical protein C2G38_2103887 [Gigaspora rosea]|uniref:Uncharacterized protein n=1 Tax=Gigaspora rosea TaxID=44941 RepID=A0A397UM35_9GLOM|nr:hypothetical protein C2G38_2103887 [Gigaspora rosea]
MKDRIYLVAWFGLSFFFEVEFIYKVTYCKRSTQSYTYKFMQIFFRVIIIILFLLYIPIKCKPENRV